MLSKKIIKKKIITYSEICLNATFSNILDLEDNKDIGR